MTGQAPAGAFICKQVHVQHLVAAARAKHGGLFEETILLHNIKHAVREPARKRFFNNGGPIWGNDPLDESVPRTPE